VQSNPYLKRLYNQYNKKYFSNRLPNLPLLFVTPGEMKKYFGVNRGCCAITCFKQGTTEPVAIYVSLNCHKSWRYVKSDLLHEMFHVARPRAEHGKAFEDEMMRIAKLGAFAGIW